MTWLPAVCEKYELGKVRLKPMQSAVSPFTVRDLRGGPLETCRAIVSHCITRAVLLADRCGSFALGFSESLRLVLKAGTVERRNARTPERRNTKTRNTELLKPGTHNT